MALLQLPKMNIRIFFVLMIGLLCCNQAIGQQNDNHKSPLLGDAIICEAGGLIGSGGGGADASILQSSACLQLRPVKLHYVMKVDVNRDKQLDQAELRMLDFNTRQRLLSQLDKNFDQQINAEELKAEQPRAKQQPTAHSELNNEEIPDKNAYPNANQLSPSVPTPAQPETFRNLRRFGIGLQRTPPPRSQPFARAAVFGSSPNFRPPRQSATFGQTSGGGCGGSNTVFVRAR